MKEITIDINKLAENIARVAQNGTPMLVAKECVEEAIVLTAAICMGKVKGDKIKENLLRFPPEIGMTIIESIEQLMKL